MGRVDAPAAARQVFFEPTGRLHPAFRYILDYPPEGYQFVLPSGWWKKLLRPIERSDAIYYNLWRLSRYLPIMLLKSRLDGLFQRPPRQSALTFAISHVITRDEPWVLFFEWVHMMVGWDLDQLRRNKAVLERLLASPNCKKVLTWCEPARQSLLHHLDCSGFMEKIDVLPLAAPARSFTKQCDDTRVRLLFVGSSHAPRGLAARLGTQGFVYDFHIKGGKEVLEAYARLKPRYPQLELTVRASVPPEYKRRYQGLPGLTIVDRRIPWRDLEAIFQRADVYVFPCHQTPPWGSILDAMSFELPVVATDVYSNNELVQDGVTGFLVNPSRHVEYYDPDAPFIPPMNTTPAARAKFLRDVHRLDEGVVEELAGKLALLIEDGELRRRMGRAGRHEVEQGSHSLATRNAKLKAIFDAARGE